MSIVPPSTSDSWSRIR